MTALDYILDGLEAELALERELGVREIELDRSLLLTGAAKDISAAPPAPIAPKPVAPIAPRPVAPIAPRPVAPKPIAPRPPAAPPPAAPPPANTSGVSICFLHDRPLDSAGSEMMAKIVAALHESAATAPVVSQGTMPRAKAYIVLGARALKKWFPERNAEPGAKFEADDGTEVSVTYSPNYILRFKTVTPAVKRIKESMWMTIKSAARKIGGMRNA